MSRYDRDRGMQQIKSMNTSPLAFCSSARPLQGSNFKARSKSTWNRSMKSMLMDWRYLHHPTSIIIYIYIYMNILTYSPTFKFHTHMILWSYKSNEWIRMNQWSHHRSIINIYKSIIFCPVADAYIAGLSLHHFTSSLRLSLRMVVIFDCYPSMTIVSVVMLHMVM